MALSKIQIIGNLGRDPELRYTPSGRPVTTFSVAVNQSTKNQQTNEWVEATDWFRVSVWGDRAERAAENLRKGSRVFVDGRFRTREYETNDGRKGLCRRGRRRHVRRRAGWRRRCGRCAARRLRRHRDRRAAVLARPRPLQQPFDPAQET